MPELISPDEAWRRIDGGALLVDVRSQEEFAEGALEGALNIPHIEVLDHIDSFGTDKAREIVVYCRNWPRAESAAADLRSLGFVNVFNAGGYEKIRAARPNAVPQKAGPD